MEAGGLVSCTEDVSSAFPEKTPDAKYKVGRGVIGGSVVIDVVEQCLADDQEETLLRLFNDQVTSDSMVQYLRLLTSAHLQNHADFFCNFVEAPDLQVYCHQDVETMAMECDHVDILALTQALDICIHIVSMEGDEQELVHHIIPEGAEPSLHLLYQTSHYNILYPRPLIH
ncbi:hypothetical protein PAMP_005605 [Pampus punctatissimus]